MWWVWMFLFLVVLAGLGLVIVLQRRAHWQHRVRDALRDEGDRPGGGPHSPVAG